MVLSCKLQNAEAERTYADRRRVFERRRRGSRLRTAGARWTTSRGRTTRTSEGTAARRTPQTGSATQNQRNCDFPGSRLETRRPHRCPTTSCRSTKRGQGGERRADGDKERCRRADEPADMWPPGCRRRAGHDQRRCRPTLARTGTSRTLGGHRGPGAALAPGPRIDDYAMDYGYKEYREAPPTASAAASSTAQLTAPKTTTTAISTATTSATPQGVMKRVLKTRKSDEAATGTPRCVLSDLDGMKYTAEQPQRERPQEAGRQERAAVAKSYSSHRSSASHMERGEGEEALG